MREILHWQAAFILAFVPVGETIRTDKPDRTAEGALQIQLDGVLDSTCAALTDITVASPPTLALRVLATSDLHAHILPWDYHADRLSHTRGLSRVAGLIAKARAEARNVVLLDNGDFLHGSPLGDFAVQVARSGQALPHPMICAMNRLGYDAATLGNHEFSHGLQVLRDSMAAARFPMVSANLWDQEQDRPFVPPFVVLQRQMLDCAGRSRMLRIGVIGFLPPQTVIWERAQLEGRIATCAILEAAREAVPRLRALGVDVVIALSHSGLGAEGGDENVSALLTQIDGIDAVIAGHTHEVFPPPTGPRSLHGKPVVMPGFFGSHLGVIDLTLRQDGAGWRVSAHQAEARPISGRDAVGGHAVALVEGDHAIEATAASLHGALKAQSERIVGQTVAPLHSYFSLVKGSLVLDLIAAAQADHLRMALSGTDVSRLPVLSAVAPFKAGGRGGPENYTDIPVGPVTERHVSDIYLHPNRLVALRLRGKDLTEWLERSVSLFHRIEAGTQDSPLVDPDFPSFNFDMIFGLTYQIDLSVPARYDARGQIADQKARRITGLLYDGRPVDPQAEFVLATNSYRSSGGSGFPCCAPDHILYSSPQTSHEIVRSHISRAGRIGTGPAAAHWRFKPMRGTTAVLQAAPAAAHHLHEIAAFRPQPLGLSPEGYQRFRLHL